MDNETLRLYYSMYTDVWGFFKKYAQKPNFTGFSERKAENGSCVYRNPMEQEADLLKQKYCNILFIQKLLDKTVDELRRISIEGISRNFKGIQTYYQLYIDSWMLFKKYAAVAAERFDDNQFWEDLVNEASSLGKKYWSETVAKQLILLTLDEIEKISHGRLLETQEQYDRWQELRQLPPLKS